jgi:magnesium transporter
MIDSVAAAYLELYPREAARTLSRVNDEQLLEVVGAVSADIAAGVLQHLSPSTARFCLEQLPQASAVSVLERMATAPAAERLRGMDRHRVQTLLGLLPRLSAIRLRIRMRHPEGTVGSLVDTDVLTLASDLKVAEAVRLVRSSHDRLIHDLYVVDDRGRLKGVVDICDLLAEKDRSPLTRISRRAPVVLYARASLRSVETHPAWLTRDHLPVIDRDGVLQGVLPRALLQDEEHGVNPNRADAEELASTQHALADIFWLALSPLFSGSSSARSRGRSNVP